MNQLHTDGLSYNNVMQVLRAAGPWVSRTPHFDQLLASLRDGNAARKVDLAQRASIAFGSLYVRGDYLMNITVDPDLNVVTVSVPYGDDQFMRVKVGFAEHYWTELFHPDNGWEFFGEVASKLVYAKKGIGRLHKFRIDGYEPVTLRALYAICACEVAGAGGAVILDMAQEGRI